MIFHSRCLIVDNMMFDSNMRGRANNLPKSQAEEKMAKEMARFEREEQARCDLCEAVVSWRNLAGYRWIWDPIITGCPVPRIKKDEVQDYKIEVI